MAKSASKSASKSSKKSTLTTLKSQARKRLIKKYESKGIDSDAAKTLADKVIDERGYKLNKPTEIPKKDLLTRKTY